MVNYISPVKPLYYSRFTLHSSFAPQTEFNKLKKLLNYPPPVQILNHRCKSSRIFNFESVSQF